MRTMSKNKKIGCLSLLLFSPLAIAMQPLDDTSLSSATGQDGISVGVQIPKLDFNQVALINSNDSTYINKSALVMAASPSATTPVIGVDFVKTFNNDGSIQNSSTELFKAVIDADAGTGTNGAFANIAISLGDEVNGLRIRPFSLYLVPDEIDAISSITPTYVQRSIFNSGTILKSNNIKEFLRISNSLDIKFVALNKPTINIQLGSTPQGKMILFGGAIDSICGASTGCNMMLVSDYATSGNSTTAPIGASFDFQFKATSTTGFRLNGFYAGIEATNGTSTGGLVFGNPNKTDNFDLNLNNVLLGTTNSQTTNSFNNLPNATIGNIGITGASVTNLKMKISGL